MKTHPKLLKITMKRFISADFLSNGSYNVKELSKAFGVTNSAMLKFITSLDYELVVKDIPHSILKAKREIKYFKVEDVMKLILKRDKDYGR